MLPFVDLHAQHKSLESEIDVAIKKVIEESSFINGPSVSEFEQKFGELHGVRHAFGVASGTDALHLAVRACGIGPGDEVVTVTNTWISTAFSVSYVGAKPVLCDVDPETHQMDPDFLKKVITDKTKAVIPVHMFGHPAPMIEIMEICNPLGIRIIEDVAQAPMASVNDQPVGTFGDIACYSFYPSKNLGCLGDGGAILTNDDELAGKISQLRDYGQSGKHQHAIVGYNSRLDTLQAAVLNAKIGYLEEWNAQRREHALTYAKYMADLPIALPKESNSAKSVYHLYVIQIEKRDECLEFLKKRGILAQVHYPNLVHLQKCYKELGYQAGDFPVAESLVNKSLSLPMYPQMTEDNIKFVADALRDFCAQ